MACHYTERGFTPVIVGATYTKSLRYRAEYRLKRANAATELCVLVAADQHRQFVSFTELSRWHVVSGAVGDDLETARRCDQ